MKTLLLILALCTSLAAQGIGGFWNTIDPDTGKARCVVAMYEYQGKYYGRIIATYDDAGEKIQETIYAPKTRAPGVVGDPFYCGLDFIWNLHDEGNSKYKGRIMDPEKGDIYHAEVWEDSGKLIVRGEMFIFGENRTWLPTKASDFPKRFKMPNVSKFVPVIPEGN